MFLPSILAGWTVAQLLLTELTSTLHHKRLISNDNRSMLALYKQCNKFEGLGALHK
jgi:hypothetical protein